MSSSKQQQQQHKNGGWNVQASWGALNTTNPIREIIETMDLAENPNKKVIPLSIGDPTIFGNLKPCEEILDALHKANSSGKHYGYQMAAGMDKARQAVAEYHCKSTGNRVKHQDVILASGCSHAIDLCICVLAGQGQNILIPRPGFPLYKTLASVYGVQYKQYDLLADKNWSIDLKHLESLIDENTAAIVVNNPSNPCGSVFSRKHLIQILELAERYKKPIIADEIYDKFVFSPKLYGNSNNIVLANSRPTLIESSGLNGSDSDTTAIGTVATAISRRVVASNTRQQAENVRQAPLASVDSTGSEAEDSYDEDEDEDEDEDQENRSSNDDDDDEDSEEFVDISVDGSIVGDDGELSIVERNANGNCETGCDSGLGDSNGGELDSVENELAYVPFISLSSLSKTVPILTCGGISKTCLIPGLRLGWIIINDRQNIFDVSVRNGLSRLTQRLMGPNSLVQGALPDILTTVPETFYSQTMDFIFKNAELCYQRLRLVKGLQPHMPQGSMYLMVRFDAKVFPDINGDLDFTSKLMNEESVLVLPGKCFDFPNYFRICLTVPTNVMEEALDRMGEFCARHYMESKQKSCNNSYAPLVKTNYKKISSIQNERPISKLNSGNQ